jgi:hypothetical protein
MQRIPITAKDLTVLLYKRLQSEETIQIFVKKNSMIEYDSFEKSVILYSAYKPPKAIRCLRVLFRELFHTQTPQ